MDLTVDQAREEILASLPRGNQERLPLDQTLGRVLSEDIVSDTDWPAFDQSAMDGYAIAQGERTQNSFEVVGESAAGNPFGNALESGQCVRIFTGAAVPPGATGVVMQEHAQIDGKTVLVEATEVGSHIRKRGENLSRGEIVLQAGTRIGAAEIGLLASMRRASLNVFVRPRVLIISTGDELQYVDAPALPHKIANSNAHMLAACARAVGAEAQIGPIVEDNAERINAAFREAVDSYDMVISSGGVSVGDHDHVKGALTSVGDVNFWKVQIKPGKPLAFGLATNGTPLFGLPGNPVSAYVCFQVFVRPALEQIQGLGAQELVGQARCTSKIKSPSREHYVPGRVRSVDGSLEFEVTGSISSADVTSFRGVNALAKIPAEVRVVEVGETVRFLFV